VAKNPQRPPKIYYGWIVVAAMISIGATTMALAGPTFGLFIEPMQTDLGFDRALFGWSNTGRMLASAVGGLFIGKMVDRHGPRVMLAVAGGVSALALMSLGFFHPSWWLIGAFVLTGLMGVQGQAAFYTGPSVAKWFIRKRAKAMGILSMGAPFGLMIGFPSVQWVISNYGWRAGWISLGVAGIIIIVPISLLVLRRQPEDMGLLPDGDLADDDATGQHSASTRPTEHQWTRAEAIRTVAFWRLTLAFSMFMFSTTSMVFFRFPYFLDKGMDAGLMSIAASTAQISLFLGAITIGRQVSSIGMERLAGLNLLVMGLCFLITLTVSNVFMMFAAFYTWAWATNSVGALQGIIYASYFGRQHSGAVRSAALTTAMLFAAVAGPLAGIVADATGGFESIWWPMVGILGLGALILMTTSPPVKRVQSETALSGE
jgi:MFS family permease